MMYQKLPVVVVVVVFHFIDFISFHRTNLDRVSFVFPFLSISVCVCVCDIVISESDPLLFLSGVVTARLIISSRVCKIKSCRHHISVNRHRCRSVALSPVVVGGWSSVSSLTIREVITTGLAK